MDNEVVVKIKKPAHMQTEKNPSEEYAEVQFSRDELIILKLAIRHHKDCSEKEHGDMSKLINAACAGFETERHYAETYCGVKYRENCARIRLNKNQFNALCIAILSSAKELRYIEAAYAERFTDLQDKLVKVMEGFRRKKYSLISSGDFWVFYCD